VAKPFRHFLFQRRAFPLKGHLLLLVAGTLLPVGLFATAVVRQLSVQEQAAATRRVQLAARNLAAATEREFSSTTTTLNVLAASEELDQDNLAAFYREAQRTAQTQPSWLAVVLLSPTSQPVLDTSRPLGAPLGAAKPLQALNSADLRQPLVGNLSQDPTYQKLAFPVQVPVIRGNQLRYRLVAVLEPTALASLVRQKTAIEGEWTRTLVDSEGTVVARTRDPERYVGKPSTPSFLQQIKAAPESVRRQTSLDNINVYAGHSRITASGWTAVVTIPVELIEAPARQASWLISGTGLALLLLSSTGALILSQQISSAIASATAAAEALAKGQQPHVKPSRIAEVETLAAALANSASLLLQREQERDQNLARAEAARTMAETTSQLKDEFLITVSHELKTPLNAILGWSALLQGKQMSPEQVQQALAVIERNARAQARLVDDLLDTSRVITGKLQLEMQLVDPLTVVSTALEAVQHSAATKGVRLDAQLASSVGSVWGDPARLQQVVTNLLSNAIKFTPAGGQVEVQLAAVGSQAQITVRDSGIGIEPAFLPHVFDRFRQADGSTTRAFGGLGLGLAIVRHLVEQHHGTVSAASAGQGKGASFTVRLPLHQRDRSYSAPLRPDLPPSLSPQRLNQVRVLVVDDEADARELVAAALQQQGAKVCTCDSAAAALAQMQTWQPQVILSDIGMAHQDGYSFMRQVRATAQSQSIPAVALTAFTRAEDEQAAIAAGYQLHIPKPIDPEALIKAVLSLLTPDQRPD
jgi:signal transduction histidine kinase/CheY-like chemotaxis protein